MWCIETCGIIMYSNVRSTCTAWQIITLEALFKSKHLYANGGQLPAVKRFLNVQIYTYTNAY